MQLIQFVGGIGDALLHCYQTDDYIFLDTLQEPVHVDFVVGNPHLNEFVQWHPNRHLIRVTQHDLEFPINSELLTRWQIPTDHRKYKSFGEVAPKVVIDQVRWYPRPSDMSIIERVRSGKPYVVFQLGAGHPTRNIPMEIAIAAAHACREAGLDVVQIGATYNITAKIMPCTREELSLHGVQHINLIDQLSIPGSLQIIDAAAGVFCPHSSSLVESWLRRKPVYCVYPFNMSTYVADLSQDKHRRFGFGFLYPECWRSSFQHWDTGAFRHWISTYVTR